MNSNRTSGFQDLVLFLARPKIVVLGTVIALIGGYLFQSNGFMLMILVPIGAAVTLVLIMLGMGLIPRIMAFVIYPSYRSHIFAILRAAWRGK